MPSESRTVREKQLEVATLDLEKVTTLLKSQGKSDAEIGKDAMYRRARATLRRARNRIHTMNAATAHVEAMKQKETKAPKVEKDKKTKVVDQIPAARKGATGSKSKNKKK